jgi:hypothetical protein
MNDMTMPTTDFVVMTMENWGFYELGLMLRGFPASMI